MLSVTVEFSAQTLSTRGRAARVVDFTDQSNQVDVPGGRRALVDTRQSECLGVRQNMCSG